ncbi:PREDICTED: serine/threonine-protein kinase BLUS1-like [Ipomoea nil]|uniref:serine/threonine-protein kinase BLUS1-like n=1 Tax=Ipomoea nil TaxID=35883 RepID=UPI000900CC93|nr:PREDICTED: serine/threonine-protein kinase BLUS1-like [Ipomoea nil]
MEFSREEHRYTPVETLRSTQNAVMLKVTYSSMASPKSEVPLQVLVVNTHKFDCVYELMKEYALARRCVHKNLVAPHVSFTAAGVDRPGNLWVVMPLVSRVSLRSMMMMSSEFRNGLPEPVVAFVLREILEGLDCIHRVGGGGNVHGNVCAGCIYMDEETTTVKLAFRSLTCEEVTGPWRECKTEPGNSLPPYATAADIWSFGLLILELLFGEIPVETHNGLQEFINNDVIIVPKSSGKYVYRMKPLCGRNPGGSGGGGDAERLSGPLGEIIKECLRKDPKKRPTAQQLLEHDYFKLSKGKGKDVKKVLVRLQKHTVS